VPLNSRDIEETLSKPSKALPGEAVLIWLVRQIGKIPYFDRRMEKSVGGLQGRIFRHWRRREYEKAAKVALEGLRLHRHKKSLITPELDHHTWWSMASHGVSCLKKGKLDALYADYAAEILAGPEPLKGIYVAECFLELSLWNYRRGDREECIRLASIASAADQTWAEAEFMQGWYGLVFGDPAADAHLMNAIERDSRILFRVANDVVCKQHPAIINRLTEAYKIKSVEGGSNHSLKADRPDGRRP